MNWDFTIYAVIMVIPAIISASVALFAWQRRLVHGAESLSVLMLATTLYALTSAFEAAAIGVPAKIFWSKVQYLGSMTAPGLFLWFALDYSHSVRWLNRRTLILIMIVPLIAIGLAWTNEYHQLIWRDVIPSPAGGNLMIYEHGAAFWLILTYVYATIMGGMLLLLRSLRRSIYFYRHQTAAILLAALFAVGGSVIYVFNLSPIPGLDWTSISFAFTGAALAWSISQYRLFDLMPVAREALIESMDDGVVVLDPKGRIAEMNPAALQLLGLTRSSIGEQSGTVFAAQSDLVERFRHASLDRAEVVIGPAEQPRYLDVHMSPLIDRRQQPAGRLLVLRDVTAYKRIEQQARQSEERLRQVIDLVPNYIFAKDAAGRFVLVNQALAQAHGTTVENLIGRTAADFAPSSEDVRHMRDDDLAVIHGDQPFVVREEQVITAGGVRYLQTTKLPFALSGSGTAAMLGIAVDVTERRHAEDVLARRAREMAALYETALEITTQVDLHTLLTAIVRRATDLLGARMGGLYLMKPDGQTLELVVGHNLPGDLVGTQLKLGQGLAGMIAQTGQLLMVDDYTAWSGRADAYAEMPFRRALGVPLNVDGHVIGVIKITDDQQTGPYGDDQIRPVSLLADHAAIAIEKVRLFDAAMQRADRLALLNRIARAIGLTLQLNDLLEIIRREIMQVMSADAFFVALYDEAANELDFRIRIDRDVREPAERQPLRVGITGTVVTSRQPLLIRNFDVEKDRLPTARIWGTGEAAQSLLCVPMLLGDKVVGVISVQAYRLNAFGDAELELLSTIADTVAVAVDNARLYDAARQHADDLEQRVADRTRELTLAYEHLQDLDRLKDQFVSRISHELRTPLANIGLYEGLLQNGKPEKRGEYLQTLQHETARLNKLIEDMLEISRLDMGQLSIQQTPLDLNRLLGNLCPDWTAAAAERGLTFNFEPAPDLQPVLADPNLLARALSSLMSNALNYTPHGGTVTCRTDFCTEADGPWIICKVQDTGPGLMPGEMSHLFERFYRGKAARNYKVPGTGLGLAIAKEIVDKLAGRITVDSQPGQGATFSVWLQSAQ